MLFPESWLRTFVDPDLDTEALAHTLTMAGLEVEETTAAAPEFSGVVVAEILEVAPHPDADRLTVCQVDDGSGHAVTIVCGAPNVAVGIKVPLARVGACLPGDLRIGTATMRGVRSSGMLCSARELGISDEHEGLLVLDSAFVPGQCVREALALDDMSFTLKLTPNRADCLSIYGVAREVAALTGADLRQPSFDPVAVTIDDRVAVDVQAPDLCGRFCGRVIRGVNARAVTPDWMVRRLLRAGQRPVSVLVDISNYVMLELGRPTHVFDLDKLAGSLEVRWARAGETLELLNGQTVSLDEDVGVIASAGKPESLAGIMGGEASSVTLETVNIYLEGAFWWPEAIMGRARRYKFSSEASHRFERGVDAESIIPHLELTTRLILEICGGQAGPIDDNCLQLPARDAVQMRLDRCHKVLGIVVGADEVADIFDRLGFRYERADNVFSVVPPSYRFDLVIEEDLIEEVARMYGFDRIPDHPPVALANICVEPETHRGPHALRAGMVAMDYQEVINFSFVQEDWERKYMGNADPIRLLNPIASQLAVMRTGMIGGLLATIRHNAQHRQSRVRVFELGRVFHRRPDAPAGELSVKGVHQPVCLAAAAWGPALSEQWGVPARQVDFYDVKRDLEALLGKAADELVCVADDSHPALHPGRSARLQLRGEDLGWLGEIHPKWVQELDLQHAPVVFEVDAGMLDTVAMPSPRSLSRQPVVIRDLAIWVANETSWQSLLDTLWQTAAADPELAVLRDIRLFDVWRDKTAQSEKSLALRFWLQGAETTLNDATVDQCMQRLLTALKEHHQARPRA